MPKGVPPDVAQTQLATCRTDVVILVAGYAAADPQASLSDLLLLEAPRDQKAVDWAKQKTQQSINRLRALPLYEQVKQELDQTLKGTSP